MAEDKSNRGSGGENRVASDGEFEFRYFANKFGLSIPQIRELFGKHGNDRETLYREARKLGTQRTVLEQ
ncbi:DUF3606 domain-containing protein [Mesorhizobium sp. M0938]|uniref:DUF3606 domain-containing protein n=1 Tax=Mesorhizobium robiniae TaxID=559315 RepID=A0ABV2GJ13_9HYPH